ncbi:MAG: YbhN family protein [Spirochaetia bacterium]
MINKKVRSSALIAVFSLMSVAGVLFLTVDERTSRFLFSIDLRFLLLLLGLWALTLSADALSISLFIRGAEERLSIKTAYRTAVTRIFFNILTPFGFGGQPFMIYLLSKEGVSPGKGSTIAVTRLMILSAYTQIGAIIAFFFYNGRLSEIPALRGMFLAAGTLGAVIIGLIFASLLYPHLMIRLIKLIGRFLHRLKIVKDLARFKRKAVHEGAVARRSFKRFFSRNLRVFVLGMLSTFILYAAQLLTLMVILRGLNITVEFWTGISLSAILLFAMLFLPTPGAAGLGEGAFILIFAGTIPKYLIGIALITWRVFFHYLTAVVGALSVSRLFSQNNVPGEAVPLPGGNSKSRSTPSVIKKRP